MRILNPIIKLITTTALFYTSENPGGQIHADQPQLKNTQQQVKETPDLNGKMNDPRFAAFVSAELKRAKVLSEKYNPSLKEITKNPFIKMHWIVTPDVIKFLKFFSERNQSIKDNPEFQKQLQESLDLHSAKGKEEITHGFTLVFATKKPNSPTGFEAKIITIFREGLFETSSEDVLAVRIHEDLHIVSQVNETIPSMLLGKGQDTDSIDTEISIFTKEVDLLKQIKQKENSIDQNAIDLIIKEHEGEVKRLQKIKQEREHNKGTSHLDVFIIACGALVGIRSICLLGRKYIKQNK